jgi:hypothetical protein
MVPPPLRPALFRYYLVILLQRSELLTGCSRALNGLSYRNDSHFAP